LYAVDIPISKASATADHGPDRRISGSQNSTERIVVYRAFRPAFSQALRLIAEVPLKFGQSAPQSFAFVSLDGSSETIDPHIAARTERFGTAHGRWPRVVEQAGPEWGARCGGPPTAARIVGHDG
jgi:hypothetical protein